MSKQIENLNRKLPDECLPTNDVGCDDLVDATLEQLFIKLASKKMTKSHLIEYIGVRLKSYGHNTAVEVGFPKVAKEASKSPENLSARGPIVWVKGIRGKKTGLRRKGRKEE